MSQSIPAFLIFWAVWILIPILVDGLDMLFHAITVVFFRRKIDTDEITDDELPRISIIIPAYNEEENVGRCINSLKIQDYPHDKLEVIVIDDGSTDQTAELVWEHVSGNGNGHTNGKTGNGVKINGKFLPVGDFDGVITLLDKGKQGKSGALNTGIAVAHGEIIINIDSDVVLAPHALRSTALAFIADETLVAATGNIRASWDIVDERDEYGNIVLDPDTEEPITRDLNAGETWMARSQFLEYLSAFSLGREAQDRTRTMYTLAGAYSAFRREILLDSEGYRRLTVSEDTDLTLDIQRREGRVGFLRDAIVYVEPLLKWDDLYAQRVRWHRGQLEVCAVHQDIIAKRAFGPLGMIGLPKMLLIDHSMAFPRLVWVMLLPLLVAFGYSPMLIFWAIVIMYGFYVLIEFTHILIEHHLVDEDTKPMVWDSLSYSLTMPFFRFIVFYFRLAGYLQAMLEPPEWTVAGPVENLRNDLDKAQIVAMTLLGGFLARFEALDPRAALAAWTLVARRRTRRLVLRFGLLSLIALITVMVLFGGISHAAGS